MSAEATLAGPTRVLATPIMGFVTFASALQSPGGGRSVVDLSMAVPTGMPAPVLAETDPGRCVRETPRRPVPFHAL
jgi:hypothetical protein